MSMEFYAIDDGDYLAARLENGAWHMLAPGGAWKNSDAYIAKQINSGWADYLSAEAGESLMQTLGGSEESLEAFMGTSAGVNSR